MARRVGVLAVFGLLGVANAVDSNVVKERPITKVVNMLRDMKTQLETDVQADEDTYSKLACWCKTNDNQKSAAIDAAEKKINQLESSIEELTAASKGLQVKIDNTHDDLQRNQASLTQSRELRMKEQQELQGEETDLIEAIKSLEGAIVALSKHHAAGLIQQRAALTKLMTSHKSLAYNAVGNDGLAVLRDFVSNLSLLQSDNKLRRAGSVQPAVFSSHSSQSGQIFGILKQMKSTFEANLEEMRSGEMAAIEQYKQLKASKEAEIVANKKQLAQAQQQKADTDEQNAADKKDLQDTMEQLSGDQAFVIKLRKQCRQTDAEYEQRQKDRRDEIVAVQDTIKILNDDDAFDSFGKSLGFIQMGIRSRASDLKRAAIAVLRSRAQSLKNTHLAAFAQQLALDAFTKVKKAIDDMVVELQRQQVDEVKQRDVCVSQFAQNERNTAVAEDERKDLETKIDNLNVAIKTLKADVQQLQEENADTKTQMKRAGDDRASENSEFQQTIFDQRATQEILKRALIRMRQVYALMQQKNSESYTPLTGDPPAKFSEYNQNKGGSKVVNMLQTVIADSKKTEVDAVKDESDSQAAYESMIKDSNASIQQKMEQITDKSARLARSEEDLSNSKDDLHNTVDNLESLSHELGDVHTECDYLMKNFSLRQDARSNEVEALRQAKSILSGMK